MSPDLRPESRNVRGGLLTTTNRFARHDGHRDLVDDLDAVRSQISLALTGRPLSVVRVLRGRPPFMQKNLPKCTPNFGQHTPT